MTEPKVSERMELLIKRAFYAAYWLGRSPDKQDKIDAEKKATQELTTAIAEIEQRAGKWERVAVALQKCRLHPQSDKVYSELGDAIAALGYEWNETVRGAW